MLKYPYPRDVEEPDKYETVRVHAEWGKARDDSIQQDNSNLAVSAVIHEMQINCVATLQLLQHIVFFIKSKTLEMSRIIGHFSTIGNRPIIKI